MRRSVVTSCMLGRLIGSLALFVSMAVAMAGGAEHVVESPKVIPVAYDVDVVVVGGSGGAIECACEAARQGASVFLLAPRPYLGTDICSTLRLWLEEDERPDSKLAVACFGEERITTPFVVKAAMDRALLEAGVSYLTGCYATDVLRDKDGQIAGVVMANRSGRQAVRAKVVVDATERAVVARLADVKFRPLAPGPQTFKRTVIGGQMRTGEGMSGEKKDFTCDSVAKGTEHRLPVYEYTLRIDMEDNGFRSFQRAENRARDMTCAAGSELASETLYHIPSDSIIGEGHVDRWPGADEVTLESFRAKGTARLYILSAYADLDAVAAAKLLQPLELMAMGRRIGRAAAAEAAETPALRDVCLPEMDANGEAAVTIGEELRGIRSRQHGIVHAGRRPLPVLGRYDVVVVGGGTSGAPSGIAAAKSGAKTLVVEHLYELGGVGTVGLIGAYWRGLRRGFTKYVDEQVNSREGRWNAVEKAEWLRRELMGSGAEVWLGTLGCGALVDDGRVCGVVVATPWGRGAVLADVVIDATGNADIAACAGAQTQYGISDRGSLNVQIAGFPDRPMKNSYVNTCYTMVDDTDVVDVWHLMAWKRVAFPKEEGAFDVGQLVDSRERRRIVGDYTLTTNDILNHRTFPDTISQHYSNFDAAAFPDADLLLVADAKGPNFHTDLPYRCLLPKGLDGILVVGLGSSADRDAMTLIRMQPDLQNQGYAAGLAAAAAVRAGGRTRDIDIKAIQKRLITEDVLDERVYTDRDSYPMSPDAIEEAVRTIGDVEGGQIELLAALAVILAHPQQAIPMLKTRHDGASTKGAKLAYAKILGILGSPAGAPTLIAAVDAHDRWDKGVPLTSERKTGNTFSELDRLVIALGFSRSPTALEALLRKLDQLRPSDNLSHYKAISLALRHHHCPAAARSLVELLKKPGFTGHATVEPVVKQKSGNEDDVATIAERLLTQGVSLNRAFKELIVAAMLYRCGDTEGIAKAILESYTNDIHGHFARYAQQTLASQLFGSPPQSRVSLSAIPSPIIFRGDATTAYRDPTVIYHDGWFRLFFTLVKIEPDKRPFSYTAWSKSRDLVKWSDPTIFTPRDQSLNYGSPGNIIRYGDECVLCLQTYPRPNGEKYGNSTARIWTMRSKDLETWGEPKLLRVKGPDVPQEKMGRMIDAFLLEDKDEVGKWWCFYKQNGVSMSSSRDLQTWTYAGRTAAGENACVIVDGEDYVLFHSPGNGVGVKRSKDLKEWWDEGVLALGQKSWPWTHGRLTAGFVLDLRKEPAVGKALMFFHGSDFPERDPRGGFDNFASIGLAWSDDLRTWAWPGKTDDYP